MKWYLLVYEFAAAAHWLALRYILLLSNFLMSYYFNGDTILQSRDFNSSYDPLQLHGVKMSSDLFANYYFS